MVIRTAITEIANRMQQGGVEDARFDAMCLTEKVSGLNLRTLPLWKQSETELTEEQLKMLCDLAERRISGEPLQYLLGEWEFFGMRLFVGKGVLIPRPDTETLVETVLEKCNKEKALVIADLCTGSGCIALALKKHLPKAEVYGFERSEVARQYAMRNAKLHNLPVEILYADVRNPEILLDLPSMDVIVSNPPYLTDQDMKNLQREVKFEPELALAGGTDGLDFYRIITEYWKMILKPGGILAYEVGMGQAEAVRDIMLENGLTNIEIKKDSGGIDRVVVGKRPRSRK